MDNILLQLEKITKLLEAQNLVRKEVLNFGETCEYLELSHSHLYKLTSSGNIPHYKPNGKKIYFKRTELEDWLLRKKTCSREELQNSATQHLLKTKNPKQ